MKKMLAPIVSALMLGSMALAGPASAVPDPQPPPTPWAMPTIVPSATTPGVTAGDKVTQLAAVGDKVFAAGTFTEVGGQARTGVAAFDKVTGALDSSFNPTVLGQVYSVAPGPTPTTVYIAGVLRSVNGVSRNKIALLDIRDGSLISTFKPPVINAKIVDVKFRAGKLYIAGDFTTVGGATRGGLASLDPLTGALTSFLTVNLQQHHNTDSSQVQKPVGAVALDVTADGSRMVVIGNFRTADGLDRDQVVQIDTSGASATVRADWQTDRFKPLCFNWSVDEYVKGVAFSPDGSYFVVGAGGGPNWGTLCDTASKWSTNASGSGLQPDWISSAGGDTISAIAVSEHAVYIGGHQRWMNNDLGADSPGAGAVPRPGLAAVDPLNGVPMTWNPGRWKRGIGVFGLLVAKDGVWVGSDQDWYGTRQYFRQKLAFFPYTGGYEATQTTTPVLPATVYVGHGGQGGTTNVLYRVNAGGAATAATDSGPDWQGDDGGSSPLHNDGSSATYGGSVTPDSSVPASVPTSVFETERWDAGGDPEMKWSFPVQSGVPVQVRLYFANTYSGTSQVGQRVFDVDVEGQRLLENFDIVAAVGDRTGTMRTFDTVSDGSIDVDFFHEVENPLINAIEIVRTDVTPQPPPSTSTVSAWTFDGSSAGAASDSATPIDWSTVRGATTVGDKLFFGSANGTLKVATFNGSVIGTPVDVNPYHDPKWANVSHGSGGTFDGNTPSFYGQIPSITGMFYSGGRLYYANGQSALKSLPFSPDSGIVGSTATSVASSMSFSDVAGMFVNGSTLYYVKRSTGDLYSIGWDGQTTQGASTLVSGPSTGGPSWGGRALFLGNPPANQAPSADFTATCTGLTCHLDASASADSDGQVTGWSWDLGDSTSQTGEVIDHTYGAAADMQVTLTVTDNEGLTSSVTKTVQPVATPAGTGFIARAATNSAFLAQKSVTVPAEIVAGDTLLLTWVGEDNAVPASDPAGWTKVATARPGTSLTAITWTRQAPAGYAGSTVTVTQPVAKNTVVQLLGYRGFTGVTTVASTLDSGTATHVAPSVAVENGDLVVHIYADRSTATSGWTADAGQIDRGAALSTASTRFSTFATDSGVRSSAGQESAATAISSAVSTKGTGTSIVLHP